MTKKRWRLIHDFLKTPCPNCGTLVGPPVYILAVFGPLGFGLGILVGKVLQYIV
jgi:hypothetical protein